MQPQQGSLSSDNEPVFELLDDDTNEGETTGYNPDLEDESDGAAK